MTAAALRLVEQWLGEMKAKMLFSPKHAPKECRVMMVDALGIKAPVRVIAETLFDRASARVGID